MSITTTDQLYWVTVRVGGNRMVIPYQVEITEGSPYPSDTEIREFLRDQVRNSIVIDTGSREEN